MKAGRPEGDQGRYQAQERQERVELSCYFIREVKDTGAFIGVGGNREHEECIRASLQAGPGLCKGPVARP